MKEELIKCPNHCLKGYVRYYPDPEIAGFELHKCPFCKGKGEVTIQESLEIEKEL